MRYPDDIYIYMNGSISIDTTFRCNRYEKVAGNSCIENENAIVRLFIG